MQNYKDKTGKAHALSDSDIANGGEYLLPDGCVKITEEEAINLAPKHSSESLILSQIAELESTITARRLREATLTVTGKSWLAARDAEIAALRAQL